MPNMREFMAEVRRRKTIEWTREGGVHKGVSADGLGFEIRRGGRYGFTLTGPGGEKRASRTINGAEILARDSIGKPPEATDFCAMTWTRTKLGHYHGVSVTGLQFTVQKYPNGGCIVTGPGIDDEDEWHRTAVNARMAARDSVYLDYQERYRAGLI